jgi:hypothetical protein
MKTATINAANWKFSSCDALSPLMPGTTIPAIGQGRDRHCQAANDTTFDTGGNRVIRLGKLKPISRHAGTKLVHGARLARDLAATQRGRDQRFVHMPPTGKQLVDPPGHAQNKKHAADER